MLLVEVALRDLSSPRSQTGERSGPAEGSVFVVNKKLSGHCCCRIRGGVTSRSPVQHCSCVFPRMCRMCGHSRTMPVPTANSILLFRSRRAWRRGGQPSHGFVRLFLKSTYDPYTCQAAAISRCKTGSRSRIPSEKSSIGVQPPRVCWTESPSARTSKGFLIVGTRLTTRVVLLSRFNQIGEATGRLNRLLRLLHGCG